MDEENIEMQPFFGRRKKTVRFSDLDTCFKDYCDTQKEFLNTLKGNTDGGKSFACFATFVILYAIFKRKPRRDIVKYFIDDTGDRKVDGIVFTIDGKPVHDSEQIRRHPKFRRFDMYFIQSKKHKAQEFSKDDFTVFSDWVKKFVGQGEVAAGTSSEQMKAWSNLFQMIQEQCVFMQTDEQPEVYIHLYYATWTAKPDNYAFQKDEAAVQKAFKTIGLTDVDFNWADCKFLTDNYSRYAQLLATETSISAFKVSEFGEDVYRIEGLKDALLHDIFIPDSVTLIGESAFGGCTGLTSVTIPDSVTEIGENAFSHSGIFGITIHFTGTKRQWNAITMGNDVFDSSISVICTDGKIQF